MSDISYEQKGYIQEFIKSVGTFKMVFMDIITETAQKRLTSETNFSNDLLAVDAYSKIPKLYSANVPQGGWC